jgi:hypothetical protein
MTFHISQALLIERTLVISVTILLFGILSIGSLLLWRRRAHLTAAPATEPSETPAQHPSDRTAEMEQILASIRRIIMTEDDAARRKLESERQISH